MIDVLAQHMPQMKWPGDEDAVGALATDAADPPIGMALARGARTGVVMT